MESAVEKIPKACEPCRKKKVRCDGKQPCQRCQRRPSECSYRQRIRIRKSARHTLSPIIGPSHARSTTNESQSESQIPDASGNPPEPKKQADHARDQLYQSVAATHGNKADSVESSRLFYGPSSQFAFLQQLHREILCFSSHHQPGDREVQEGGPGLDLFVQRSIFFGIAQRTRSNPLPSHMSLISSLPVQQAVEFLAGFKAAASPIVPLFADQELDDLLHHFYSDESDSSLSPQRRALTLAILAIGGLTTAHTDVAELLFIKAKQEAVVCDDVQVWRTNTNRGELWRRFNYTVLQVYYHVILLTYRPFLIADSALKPAGGPKEPDTMWLRQACRYAIDAAQDSIVYAASSFRKDEACKTTRYYAFFLDANCVVLMYDMLRHPAKRNYNVDYINMALQMLSSMVQDEPVTVSQNSMKQMLRLVEDIILNGNRVTGPSTELASLASSNTTAVEVLSDTQQGPPHPNFQFPSLNAGSTQSQQFIHFSNLPAVSGQGNFDNALNIDGSAVAYANPLPYFQNDVITTDLFNFFPVDLLSPYNTSSLEGADNHNT
ncbi:hypothetical protein TruAng_004211 [Truncatella angustata]|nr:hypothetical protein TruAng_004211 [Truncatella angustata]